MIITMESDAAALVTVSNEGPVVARARQNLQSLMNGRCTSSRVVVSVAYGRVRRELFLCLASSLPRARARFSGALLALGRCSGGGGALRPRRACRWACGRAGGRSEEVFRARRSLCTLVLVDLCVDCYGIVISA